MSPYPSKPKHIVPSGKFAVRQKAKLCLEAYLGTCVGITLCDRRAGVGGLIHLILPAPTGADKPWHPEAYAETGMPLFLQAIYDAGASKDHLEACIAGGALMGPVSKRDLDLDIGGRTTEIVQTVLKNASIPIINAETGGSFGCRLNLDLLTFKSAIEPIALSPSSIKTDFTPPRPEEIDAAILRASPIPQIALKIIRMINYGKYNMTEIGREIKTDQVISAKIIQLCNSAFISSKNISSIDRALVILGEQMLLKLVVSSSVESYFSASSQGYSLCRGGLFQHALRTAMVAEKLARFTGKATPDIAYTAGLLHDIGKVVLDHFLVGIWPFFYRRTQIDGIELCETESEKLGITHTQAGRLLAEQWALPENLRDTIQHHHFPENATVDPNLTHLVYLADLIMSRFQVGHELECLNVEQLAMRLAQLELSTSQLPEIVELIPQEIFE